MKGMIIRGDRQQDVAAYFGVNQGRIAEIACGSKFANVLPEDVSKLPQPVDPRLYGLMTEAGCNVEQGKDLLPQLIQMRNKLRNLISSVENSSRR